MWNSRCRILDITMVSIGSEAPTSQVAFCQRTGNEAEWIEKEEGNTSCRGKKVQKYILVNEIRKV